MIDKIVIKYEQRKKGQNPASFIARNVWMYIAHLFYFLDRCLKPFIDCRVDKGTRYLIQNKIDVGIFTDFTLPKYLFDVDTKEDYMTLLQISNSM